MKEFAPKVSLFGKHQSSSEYLYLGEMSSFVNSISRWIKESYEVLLQSRVVYNKDALSYFYFLNEKEDSFVCGTLMMSRDSQKREYPLAIFVELSSYSSFLTPFQSVEQSQAICKDIFNLFNKESTLEELKLFLTNLSISDSLDVTDARMRIDKSAVDRTITVLSDEKEIDWQVLGKDISKMPVVVFMDKQFVKAKLFYRVITANDFITIMR